MENTRTINGINVNVTRPCLTFSTTNNDDGTHSIGKTCWTPLIVTFYDDDEKSQLTATPVDSLIIIDAEESERWVIYGHKFTDLDGPFLLLTFTSCIRTSLDANNITKTEDDSMV